jgi:hypothetical protein
VRSFEQELEQTVAHIRARAHPGTTLLVGFDSHFLGYRHGGYYLPEYRVLQYPEIAYRDGVKVFAVSNGRTVLKSRVSRAGVDEVALVPLPDEPQYRAFLQPVLARIRGMQRSGSSCVGSDVCVFSAQVLHELFPRAAGVNGS